MAQRLLVAPMLLVLAFGRAAGAQPTDQRAALAESLFQDAKRLMEENKPHQACPKLAESQRLDPGGGTLLNLAKCYEAIGKTASAWSSYQQAIAAAAASGRADREELARARTAELEKILSRLFIEVHPASADLELRVEVDGVLIGRAAWATPFPVDPGKHVIRAAAPGDGDFTQRVLVASGGGRLVHVPKLDAEEPRPLDPGPFETAAPEVASVADPQPTGGDELGKTTPPVLGWTVGALGVASLGVGTFLGVRALELRSDSDGECPSGQCTRKGKNLNDRALRYANGANVTVGVGLVGIAIGTYLLVKSRRERAPQARWSEGFDVRLGRRSGSASYSAFF